MMPDCVCVSNFGVGGGFGFNRVNRFVNFIWVSCFFFFFFFVFNSYWYIFYWFLVLILLIMDFWFEAMGTRYLTLKILK